MTQKQALFQNGYYTQAKVKKYINKDKTNVLYKVEMVFQEKDCNCNIIHLVECNKY